jgi:hypothetical protein
LPCGVHDSATMGSWPPIFGYAVSQGVQDTLARIREDLMPQPKAALRIDLARARAHWHWRQGLAEPMNGPLEEVVAETGWPRTLGGVDVYLALRARAPGMRRSDLDEAVEEARLQVIPAVRGPLPPALRATWSSRAGSSGSRRAAALTQSATRGGSSKRAPSPRPRSRSIRSIGTRPSRGCSSSTKARRRSRPLLARRPSLWAEEVSGSRPPRRLRRGA